MSKIAIYDTATGALFLVRDAAGYDPSREPAGRANKPAPDAWREEWRWDAASRSFVADLATLKATLIAQVKATNEQLVRSLYSTNYGKQKKYSRKQQETLDLRSLAGGLLSLNTVLTQALSAVTSAFNGLNPLAQRRKFRFIMAQAARRNAVNGTTNVTADVIAAEIEARIDSVEDQVAFWEAIEIEAVRMISAATTAAQARAIVAGLDWNWKAWA